MENFNHNEIKTHFNKHGTHRTLKIIFHSEKVPYLNATDEISKILELTSLTKGERSIVKYLNFIQDTNRSNGSLYPSKVVEVYSNNIHKSTNEQKMSARQIKSMKSQIKRLSHERLDYLKTFIGVTELERDGVQSKGVLNKLNKIQSLYTARIPKDLMSLDHILEALENVKIKVSNQDLISFFSILNSKRNDSNYVSIPASIWIAFFGRRKIKVVKRILDELNVLNFEKPAIPGFRAEIYYCNFLNDINFSETIEVKISSIRTLEKINRIKVYDGKFSFTNRLKALKYLSEIYLERKLNSRLNLTSIFLHSGEFQPLIDDFNRMSHYYVNFERDKEAVELGTHLTRYINYIATGHYKRYFQLFEKEQTEVKEESST